MYGDMYGIDNTEKEKINEVIDSLCNRDTVCCCTHMYVGNNSVSRYSGQEPFVLFTSFSFNIDKGSDVTRRSTDNFSSTIIRFSFVLWLLFLCAVEEKFYDNELNVVSDLACIFKFSPDMIADWINFVKYSLTGSKNFEFKQEEQGGCVHCKSSMGNNKINCKICATLQIDGKELEFNGDR